MSSLFFFVYPARDDEWRWRLTSDNGRIVADSGEGYKDQRECVAAIELIKRDAPGAAVNIKPKGS